MVKQRMCGACIVATNKARTFTRCQLHDSAPELLGACELAVATLLNGLGDDQDFRNLLPDEQKLYKALKAAISKAKGESHA